MRRLNCHKIHKDNGKEPFTEMSIHFYTHSFYKLRHDLNYYFFHYEELYFKEEASMLFC